MTAPVLTMAPELTPSFRIAAALIAAEQFAKNTKHEILRSPTVRVMISRDILREADEVIHLISEARDCH